MTMALFVIITVFVFVDTFFLKSVHKPCDTVLQPCQTNVWRSKNFAHFTACELCHEVFLQPVLLVRL